LRSFVQGRTVAAVEVGRGRHSVISLAVPLDAWQSDPCHLRDHQKAQLFWNTVFFELAWLSFLNQTDETTDAGKTKLLTVMIKSLTVAAVCLVVALVSRSIFRWGNNWLLREGATPRSHCRWRVCAKGMLALAWFLNLFFFAGTVWVAIAYGRCYDIDMTHALLRDFLISVGVSWFVVEPAQIVLIVLFPCIFNSDWAQKCFQALQNVGIDPAILM